MELEELRKRAEAVVLKKSEHLKDMSLEEIQHLIHELHTHQIEVEMQNEELHRTQEELSKSLTRYSSLYHSAPVGYLTLNEKDLIVEANYTIAEMLSLPTVKLIGFSFTEFIAHADQDIFYLLKRRLLENKTTQNCELQLNHPSQNNFWAHIDCNAIFNDLDQIHEMRISISDITDYKLMQEELGKLSKAVHNAGELVMITDRKSVIEYVNPAFCDVTGYSPEEVIGKTPNILKSSAQEHRINDKLRQTISSGNVWHGSLIDKKKDGTFFPVWSSIVPICDKDGLISNYVFLQQDMTEYKNLEEQFIHSQKMESIGVLVGGIAHDFNNILSGIMGSTFLAKSEFADNPKLLKRLEMINTLSDRATNMINQLLAFARKDVLIMKTFSFTKFLKEAVKLSMTSIPENIDKQYDFTLNDLYIHGDATQLQQVLMNLINNSRDALEDTKGGIITCALKEYIPDNSFRTNHPVCKEDKYACLTVSDNGKGIPEEAIDKVFDPFFTTKGVGEGTGLGLSMVYGVIKNHNGIIDLNSIPGQGTIFNIYLPIVPDKAKELVLDGNEIVTGEKELILIADDEDMLLELQDELLHNLGYRTIIAHNGGEAIQLFEQYKNEISLVILDVVMPIKGGVDAAKEIHLMNDQVPIIFSTGYDKDTALKNVDDIPNHEIITKPYSVESLSQVICKCLN